MDGMAALIPIIIVVGGIILIMMFLYFIPVGLFMTALFAGVRVGLFQLFGMRIRKVPPAVIVNSMITAHKAGIPTTTDKLESHFLAGGNVQKVVAALISADKAGIHLSWEKATAIDLAGRDVLEAVKISVNPKVIETPPVSAMARNGIQVRAVAKVTVRANLDRFVGGAGENTVIARVGEGIVTTIGSSDTHSLVLENPDRISRTVLEKGLDAGTAFEILSIDIADVDVGENVGAKLASDQAQADLNVARAKAEERRAAAVAVEQEMKARVHEMRAKVVEAEAQVPLAMAEALREGNIGALDYYNLKKRPSRHRHAGDNRRNQQQIGAGE
ncbi:MAG: SigmaW regulon antibacterial [Chlorobi bacterium OLB7]|nr:MAG: SigmaW regulon antibacterial [Chlorobi bacterium OLB7]